MKIINQEPSWLKQYRQRNLEIFQNKPLKKSQYFDVKKLDAFLKFSDSQKELILPKEIEKSGLRVITWEQALKEREPEIKLILEKEENPKNQYEAFVNAHFNSGFVIIAKRDSIFDGLIQYKIENTSDLLVKNIIIIEGNVENIKILEHLNYDVKFVNETIFIGQDSKATFCRIFNLNDTSIINQQTLIGKDAKLKTGNAFLNGNFINTRIVNSLYGQGSSLEQLDLSLLNKNQFFSLDLQSIHKATDVYSFSVLKTVLKDQSKNLFDGMIKITPDGQKANALLQSHSLLISKDASSNNIPSLEIEADDVRATHSATSTNMDEDQLFYLESRGVSKEEAKHTIVKGFLESIIFKLPEEYNEPLSNILMRKIEDA